MENKYKKNVFSKFKISLSIVLTFKPTLISNCFLKVFKLTQIKAEMDEHIFQVYRKKVGKLSIFYITIGIFLGTLYGPQLKPEYFLLYTFLLFLCFLICDILFLMVVLPKSRNA